MNNFKLILISLILIALISPPSSAAKSEVTWTNPEKYRDIKAGDENRKTFKTRVFKTFEKHFAKLAEKLPEGQTLKIDVTDVDLAGDVDIGGIINRIRIVTDLYFPRMKFSYNLINADNTSIKSGEINLKDMGFMLGSNLRYRNDSFGYDKKMIAQWFKDTFKDDYIKK
ncbi:MAG: hypothetical protein COB35_12185 [Gammaproteobacteria bacterium]|nr:MAG: hypothetical protein COB35_12185 [Gammaproteobacteria bacterium]